MSDIAKLPGVPDDLQPKRIDKSTVEFLGISFVATPAPPKHEPVAKPVKLARVSLTAVDGNAYMLIGTCLRAGKKAGYTAEQLIAFKKQATSGNYGNVLRTCCEWFEVM